jgi:hypothetical protein
MSLFRTTTTRCQQTAVTGTFSARIGQNGQVPQVPIACTLTEEGLDDRVDEWRRFLTTSITTVDAGDTSARLLLHDGDDVLLRAVDLAEREKACCAFFEFGLALDGGERWLTVAVPDEAAPVLRDLLSLAAG